MKKVLLMCFMLLVAFTMVGCNNSNQGDNMEFLGKNNTDIQQIIKISLDKG